MNAEILAESPRVTDVESYRAWIARLDGPQAARLPSVDRLMRNLSESPLTPTEALEIAEQARLVHVAELDGMLERIDAARFPLSEADRTCLFPALESLRLGRDLFKKIHTAMSAEAAAATDEQRSAGARQRDFIPLARALDYQVRLLVALQRNKIVVGTEEWNELCSLATRLRIDGFIDTPLQDSLRLLAKSATPRALFIYPVLLWLARPDTRTEGGFALAARLARRWCGHIGFRFESDPDTRDIRHGPTVTLSELYSVRLVTHRLRRRIEDRRRQLEALGANATRLLPHGMTVASTHKLLTDLIELWCEPRLVPRVPELSLGEVQIRFGLPRREEEPPGAVRKPVAPSYSQVGSSYVYGHFEQDMTIRRPFQGRLPPDQLTDWTRSAQRAEWVSMERQQAVFQLSERAGGLCLGAMATIVTQAAQPTGSAPVQPNAPRPAAAPRRMFGRVISLQQQYSGSPREVPSQRVCIAFWPGSPSVAAVKLADSGTFEDTYLLVPDPGTWDRHSLVLPAGRFVQPCTAVLREQGKETKIQLEELIERGAGYDRVRYSAITS